MIQPIALPQENRVWHEIKYQLNHPRTWVLLSAIGIVAGIVLKIQAIALIAASVFARSLVLLYDMHRLNKTVDTLNKDIYETRRLANEFKEFIAPGVEVVNEEAIVVPDDILGFLQESIHRLEQIVEKENLKEKPSLFAFLIKWKNKELNRELERLRDVLPGAEDLEPYKPGVQRRVFKAYEATEKVRKKNEEVRNMVLASIEQNRAG